MTVAEIRQKFPEESQNKTDEELVIYAQCSEILSEIFINQVKKKYQKLDNDDNN